MSKNLLHSIASFLVAGIACCNSAWGQKTPDVIRFNQHVRPIMSNTCFACHGPDESTNESGLRLDSFQAAVDESEAITPGDPQNSLVFQRIMDSDDPMPPSDFRHQLSDYEKAVFEKWIRQGAKYETHWSYSKLSKPEIPKLTKHSDRVANPIDSFVLQRLESLGVEPAPLADKRTLLRRLSLDLIGLPPAQEDIKTFLADDSENAYEKQVDRLLASPQYGERMASRWLDIVRFSDTVGFHGDQNQRVFPYRDYVINSLNDNQPFDEFTIEQLAGDLLEFPTEQQLVATGAIRLNMMTREGGAQPEEYLAKYSADRVRMVGAAWLGATLGCCECHDHKYDPFSIKDFYSMAAYFDDVRQWGVYMDYGYTPNPDLRGFSNDHPFPPEIRVKSSSLIKQIEFLERQLDEVAARNVSTKELNQDEFKGWLDLVTRQFANDHSLWTSLKPDTVNFSKKEKFKRLSDHSVLFTEKPKSKQTITITSHFDQPMFVKSVKMQVLPDSRNDNKVGRSDGKFSSQLTINRAAEPSSSRSSKTIKPRYVRIELPGEQKILSLAEVQVFGRYKKLNLARSGKATQSSVDYDGPPGLAIDGRTNGDHSQSPVVTHTKSEDDPWWELDLQSEKRIERIILFNRTDGGLGTRLKGYQLVLLDEDRNIVYQTQPELPQQSVTIAVPKKARAEELVASEKIAYAQADRYRVTSYSNGKAKPFLRAIWNSGPSKWQLPENEASLPHNAVYHLEQPIRVEKGQSLEFKIESTDVGRVRFFVSPLARPVVDDFAANAALRSALEKLTQVAVGDAKQLSESNWTALKSAFYRSTVPSSNQKSKIKTIREEIARCYSGFATTLVTQPVEKNKIRSSRVLRRGDWKDKSGEVVSPNTPSFLPGIKQHGKHQNRLDLANWLVSKKNPLTARHYVNRTWKHFFGNGLSNVLDDLGNQGEWPSHPALLDWLASDFRSDWDRKRLTRLIVTSNTYRQQAGVLDALQDKDPGNRLLAQQSPRRLEAEIIRDNALAIAGLLNTEWVGGRSIFPYQPPGYYANLQFPNRRYVPQSSGLQYRRGVYVHWQRTFLHPMLTNFDAPSRDECTADRIQSNSPQQALTLLNDPVFVEAAVAFAIKLLERGAQKPAELVDQAFQIALSRSPSAEESQALQSLYQSQLEHFTENQSDARDFCAIRIDGRKEDHDTIQLAALGQVCRVILNLQEVITRY